MFRSIHFNRMYQFLSGVYPDTLDQQLLLTFTQMEWDYTDPINFAPHLLDNPLPGSVKKRILVQESIGDAQVPNMSTRMLVRTIGLPGLALVQPVQGVETKSAPLDSAYTQWDAHKLPLPELSGESMRSA